MLIFLAGKIVGIVMSVFGPDYATFAVGRFLMGAGDVGYGLTAYVVGNDEHTYNVCNGNNNKNNKNTTTITTTTTTTGLPWI